MAYEQLPPAPTWRTFEHVPYEVADVLSNHGWAMLSHHDSIFFTHPAMPGYFSWSEALSIINARGLIELSK